MLEKSILKDHPILTAAAALGVANHLFLKRYEPSRRTVIHAAVLLLVQPVLLPFLLQRYAAIQFSLSDVGLGYLAFFTSLTSSIVLYRTSPFHPLARVPGPMIFKITKLWRVYLCYKGHQDLDLKALHDKYGPIVRTGPNDISVIDAKSVKSVLSSDSMSKGPAYLTIKEPGRAGGLIQLPFGDQRTDRRRIWNRGFTTEAIKSYQEIVMKKAAQLAEGLGAQSNSEVDLLQWMGLFSFDFMAEMAFGGGSEMLKEGKDTIGAAEVIRKGMWIAETFSHIPWFTSLARSLPPVWANGQKLRGFAEDWCMERIQRGAEKKDLWYHLTDEAGHEKVKPTIDIVASDAGLAIIAGSDTTSTAVTNLFWCLMAHPETYERLREEVDREYPMGIDPLLDTSRHGNKEYLTACLNESLRLFPPVPSNGPRVVGTEGRVIHGHYLPERTQVYVPPYAVHRNPENFSPAPDSFLPERWLGRKDANFTIKMDAFIPFSAGPANCIGKNLARLEMMMVITMLVQKFEFEFGKGFNWKEWPSQKIDAFVSQSEPLKVVVKPRF
ncbi:hypothetical protein V5O48_005436 [Marasmius crinis-equi]|uniref:Cytochrome P450 n=1 Tax=Marasmius crinis-equi TaxID=585013 RepID=A0ABR3FMQ2_9AGAR